MIKKFTQSALKAAYEDIRAEDRRWIDINAFSATFDQQTNKITVSTWQRPGWEESDCNYQSTQHNVITILRNLLIRFNQRLYNEQWFE